MRCVTAAVIIAASIVTTGTAAAQSRDDNWARCKDFRSNPDLSIEACTAIIQSGQETTTENLAVAFNNRGSAYNARARRPRHQDYDRAIKLDPNYAIAFNNRGNAYRRTATTTAPSRTSTRRSGSIPITPMPSTTAAPPTTTSGDYDRAIQDFDQAIRLNPNTPSPTTIAAMPTTAKGEYDRAIQDYDQAIRLDPNYALAFNNRGLAYHDKREYDRAIQDFDQAIRLDPNYAWPSTTAASPTRQGRVRPRHPGLRPGDQLDPNYAEAYNNRGAAYDDKREYDRAIQDYDQAIRLNPNYALAFYNRGIAYATRRLRPRHPDFDQAIRLDPKYALRLLRPRHRLRHKREYDRAIHDSTRRSSSIPITRSPFTSAASPMRQARQRPRHRGFRPGHQLDPNNTEAFYNRGTRLQRKGDVDHAIADFNQAISSIRRYADAFPAAAAPTARSTITSTRSPTSIRPSRFNPNYALAFNNRCFARAVVNRFPEALADCNEALRLRPGDGEALGSRGLAYLKLKKADLAVADFDAKLQAAPKDAYALYGRGMAKRLKGDEIGANADIAAAKQISPAIAERFDRYGVPAP